MTTQDPYKRYKCPCCNERRDNYLSMAAHHRAKHRTGEKLAAVYFDKNQHLRLFRACRNCGILIRGSVAHIDQGGRRCCSNECNLLYRVGRKQSAEVISRRLANTDQKAKEAKRQATMLERYGKGYVTFDEKKTFAKRSAAAKRLKHTAEQHRKIVESKLRNGTLHHKQETKDLVSRKVRAYYQNPANLAAHQARGVGNFGRGHRGGVHRGLYCRSSYEKLFLDFCYEFGIKVLAPDTSHIIQYIGNDDRLHRYFPDFYLPSVGEGTLVEIKPLGMYNFGDNVNKYVAGMMKFPLVVITEEEGLLDRSSWQRMYTDLTGEEPFLV